MAHLQYMPGDPRLVDQLVCELKSKGIFDQFRKECIADVDTRPAYQNLRQRVESSVATFLSRQIWKPELNKNQLREKLRKHLLDGNYLEQGVERIVDQVVNPKVASVFIPQVEDLVYNYLGIPRKKTAGPETSNGKAEDLLPTDLEAVSPGSVKSHDDKDMDISEEKEEEKMEVDDDKPKTDVKEDSVPVESIDKEKEESRLSGISELTLHDSDVSVDKNTVTIPLPAEEIKLENIPAPENSPPNIKNKNIDLEKIDLPKEPNLSTDIPLPDEIPKSETDVYFKPIQSEDDDSSSDSSVRRNVSPLTPIRNFNNENSCDAQQAFENDEVKDDEKKEPSSFRFTIESKIEENSADEEVKMEKKEETPFQFNIQSNLNTFNTPLYDDSSNSNNLQIDYESDANSKAADLKPPEVDQNSGDSSRKDKKDEKKSSHKSSHRSRDSNRHSSSKDKRSDSKLSKDSSRDSSRHDKKKDDKGKSSNKEKSSEKSDKKDSRDSSKHRSSSSYKSSSHKDSKHRSSSSSKHSSKDDKKSSSSSQRDKEKDKNSDKSDKSDKSKDKPRDSKSSSSRDKDRRSSSSKKSDEKENKEKKEKKETDDHYSLSGRGNPNRRSTDRDSNDGSSSSKGSHRPCHSKSSSSKKDGKGSSKSDNTSTSESASPSDAVEVNTAKKLSQNKAIRIDTHLGNSMATPPRLPFVPDVTIKKPKFAANMEEARQKMKMRKFLEEEQKRMNQEAALLLEFQANVRPSLSQVYSSIPGPELEFACVSNIVQPTHSQVVVLDEPVVNCVDDTKAIVKEDIKDVEIDKIYEIKEESVEKTVDEITKKENDDIAMKEDDEIAKTLIAMHEDGTSNEELEFKEVKIDETVNIEFERLTGEVEMNDDEKIETVDKNNETSEEGDIKDETVETVVQNNKASEKEDMNDENTQTDDKDNTASDEGDEQSNCTKVKEEKPLCYGVTVITEEMFDTGESQDSSPQPEVKPDEISFQYFAEQEKYDAEIESNKFKQFLKRYTANINTSKIYLVNCDTYEENLIREASHTHGEYEIVTYYKNNEVTVPKTTKNIVKNVNVATEITLPAQITVTSPVTNRYSPIFSPVKSECSFELSSDYDNKLEEMVNKTSRQEIMEIILGSVVDDSLTEMPQVDYCMDSNIEDNGLKRKMTEVESTNNNRQILTPNKMRKLSGSDQISSTTEETEETPSSKVQNNTRSKYLGKAKRVGLSKPKKTTLPNSPSSDKSVENYEQNEAPPPNGKMKNTPRSKVQRYDTSDLYKPKLHYLSRRNNIT